MRVLHAFAHLDEQFQPFSNPHPLLIAIFGDGRARHILHHEVGFAGRLALPEIITF
jgi:hypothetical protein